MSRVVWYRPLDGIGEAYVDLNQCIRRFVIPEPDEVAPHEVDVGERVFYLFPDGRWIEYISGLSIGPDGRFEDVPLGCYLEVTPTGVIEELESWRQGLPPKMAAAIKPFGETIQRLCPESAATNGVPESPAELPDLVTLDEAAAVVHRKKRTLERRKTNGKLPPPSVEGGGGKPDLWDWPTIRPWLMKEFGVILPERFPTIR